MVLTGDVNMDKSACDTVVQKIAGDPSAATQWQVLTSIAELSGDVLFIKGALGDSFDVTVGASYPRDRGIRNDCHDFFGVSLSIPMIDKNPRGQKRQQGVVDCASLSAGPESPKDKRATQQSGSSSKDKVPRPSSSTSGAQESGSSSKDKLSPRPTKSASGASQLAASSLPLVEERVAKNGHAYTKAAFIAFFGRSEYAEQKWASASLPKGAMNCFDGRVVPRAERILQEMYIWYESRVEDEELHVVFRHLQHTLFKNVTVPIVQDVYAHPDVGGASQLAAPGEAQMVVSREHVARQVQTVIGWRERWLHEHKLPMNTVLRDDMADRFLDDAKEEYHNEPLQLDFQARDIQEGGNKKLRTGKHSRWSRHQQRLGGTAQMWTLLSFTGRFDVAWLMDSIAKAKQAPPRMPGERTEEEKQKIRDGQEARSRLRRGAMLERLQERIQDNSQRDARPLTPKQLRELEAYQSGELRREANKFTKISGHGRLRKEDYELRPWDRDSFVDIGGSTGGFVRTVLDDWEPPDVADFEEDPRLVEVSGDTDED